MRNKQKLNYSVEELVEIIEYLLLVHNREDSLEDLVTEYRKKHQPALLKPKNK